MSETVIDREERLAELPADRCDDGIVPETTDVEIWLAVDAAGKHGIGSDIDEAEENYNFHGAEPSQPPLRMICLRVVVPLPQIEEVSVTLPNGESGALTVKIEEGLADMAHAMQVSLVAALALVERRAQQCVTGS